MGVSIPEEYRREMAMAGDWETTHDGTVIKEGRSKLKKEDGVDVEADSLAVGVRKRKAPGEEDAEDAGVTLTRRGWGNTIKSYPGANDEDDDLDALFKRTKGKSIAARLVDESADFDFAPAVKQEDDIKVEDAQSQSLVTTVDGALLKSEPSDWDSKVKLEEPIAPDRPVKEETPPEAEVFFKKRKVKNIRQK
jgi:hypothetical protein